MESMAQQAALAEVGACVKEIMRTPDNNDAHIEKIQLIYKDFFGIDAGRRIPEGKPKELATLAFKGLMENEKFSLAASFAKDYGL